MKDQSLHDQDLPGRETAGEGAEETAADKAPGQDTTTEAGGDALLEQALKEKEEAQDKYVRLVAEFDNFRKRNARERTELIQTAGRRVIESLLEVLDDVDRADVQLETAVESGMPESVREGVTLIFGKLRHKLQQEGVRKMESLNGEFDAELHEAVAEIPVTDESKKGKIMDVIMPGYYLNDKLIRHAKVVVGK